MEPQSNVPEAQPMLIAAPQLWVNLSSEHRRRLLTAVMLICQELLSPPQVGPQGEVPHD
jgi:hypothetical protein